jgi:hypothetical protein
MKNLLFLFLMVFVTTVGYTQEVPDKSNTIIITLSDSATAADKVKKAFTSRDHTVNAPGKDATIITTAAKTLKNGARVSFSAQLKGKDVILTGKIMIAGQSNMVIVYGGKKGTPFMNGWEEMDKIAKEIGGKIRYEKK